MIQSRRVLIVEDDHLLSLIEERAISRMGHQVIGKANSGEEAVEIFSKLNPDLILMDISLSGPMDGFETVEAIRQNSKVPVVFLSGTSTQSIRNFLQDNEQSAFVEKPFTFRMLSNSIKKICSESLHNEEIALA